MSKIAFGTDGWRGIIADDFTFSNVVRVVEAVASFLLSRGQADRSGAGSPPRVVVGRDTRFLSDEFARTAAAVLVKNGITPLYIGEVCPTPVTARSVLDRQADGALMFTASHNPAQYHGVKFIPEYAGPAEKGITDEITKHLSTRSEAAQGFDPAVLGDGFLGMPPVEVIDPAPDYLRALKRVLDADAIRKSGLKVVADPLYGAGRSLFPRVLEELGCEVRAVHTDRDPLFGGGMPDPAGDNLEALRDMVAAEGADLGLALDGDGDRFGAVDSTGKIFTANQILALIARHLLKNRGLRGAIIRSVATTHLLDKIASRHGAELKETEVGFKHVGKLMREMDAVLGGEESGGLSIQGHIPEKDGLLADLLLAEMVAVEGKTLSQLLDELEQEFGAHHTSRVDRHVSEGFKASFFESIKANPPASVGDMVVHRIDDKDGVKFYLEREGWVLFRPSGTEPLVRIYIEALSKEDLRHLKTYSLKLFQSDERLEVIKE